MLLPTKFPRIFELQAKLYTKQREFIKGIRNKMPHAELKELNEELKKIRQEILALKSNEL